MSSDSYDIAVVGAGPVGLFAAFYAGIRGMRTLVVDSLHQPGGQLAALYPEKPIYDMPGFPEILAKDLAQEMMRQAERFSPTICLGNSPSHFLEVQETSRSQHLTANSKPKPCSYVRVLVRFHPQKSALTQKLHLAAKAFRMECWTQRTIAIKRSSL